MSKSEIEKELDKRGDFVAIDELTKFSRQDLSIDMKKFVYLRLAGIYERKGMLSDAARMFNNVALASIAFSEKIKSHVKEAELYIKAGNFEKVDEAMKKAMREANASQKAEIYFAVKDFYKRQAEIYEKEMKRNHASKIYERLLQMNMGDLEKQEIKEKLLDLYDKLGRFKEYNLLKKGME